MTMETRSYLDTVAMNVTAIEIVPERRILRDRYERVQGENRTIMAEPETIRVTAVLYTADDIDAMRDVFAQGQTTVYFDSRQATRWSGYYVLEPQGLRDETRGSPRATVSFNLLGTSQAGLVGHGIGGPSIGESPVGWGEPTL